MRGPKIDPRRPGRLAARPPSGRYPDIAWRLRKTGPGQEYSCEPSAQGLQVSGRAAMWRPGGLPTLAYDCSFGLQHRLTPPI